MQLFDWCSKKSQLKKVVCEVPVADGGVSTDLWAWRKYGQKPIKGSPYPRLDGIPSPLASCGERMARTITGSEQLDLTHWLLCFLNRGYYRCSSFKECAARKQVERSHLNPNTFILTYIGEHNHAMPTHQSSLARTTRHKFTSSTAPLPPPSLVVGGADTNDVQHQQPSPILTSMPTVGLSPTMPMCMPSMEEDNVEDKDELLVEDMEIAGEGELLFLNTDGDYATPLESLSSLFDMVNESSLSSP